MDSEYNKKGSNNKFLTINFKKSRVYIFTWQEIMSNIFGFNCVLEIGHAQFHYPKLNRNSKSSTLSSHGAQLSRTLVCGLYFLVSIG